MRELNITELNLVAGGGKGKIIKEVYEKTKDYAVGATGGASGYMSSTNDASFSGFLDAASAGAARYKATHRYDNSIAAGILVAKVENAFNALDKSGNSYGDGNNYGN